MSKYSQLTDLLEDHTYTWTVTGVAGFIGSHLLQNLLNLNQNVIGVDNFSTGHRSNLDHVKKAVSEQNWSNFIMVEGDVRDFNTCQEVTKGSDFVLHQAALGSVPRSIEDPLLSHDNNVNGHLNMLRASDLNKVKRIVYASSSSVYGDSPDLPKIENIVGEPLSPYAATKKINEIYSQVFQKSYNLPVIGLRYFNVYGARQDPDGPYAAVIPKWSQQMLKGKSVYINGDGKTSRDFSYVGDVVQANLLAATTENKEALGEVFNVAFSDTTTLNDLFNMLYGAIKEKSPSIVDQQPEYRDFRPGDILHSFANVDKARQLLGYEPKYNLESGLKLAADWYIQQVN